MDDTTTFFLAFLAVFLGIAALLWHLERRARALEDRVATLEAASRPSARPPDARSAATTTTPKPGDAQAGRKA